MPETAVLSIREKKMIDENALQPLKDNGVAERIIVLEEVGSTNDMAKQLLAEDFRGTALITAECQTAGRGRLGRSWASPPGTGIWMSYLDTELVPGPAGHFNPACITLLAGLSVAEAVNEYAESLHAGIKWPNDVVVNGRKLCGILTELVSQADNNSLIVGIGINTGQDSFPPELSDKATSYFLETGAFPEREVLIRSVIEKLRDYCISYRATGNLSNVMEKYNSLMISRDREVVLTSANGEFRDNPYISRGITETGDLIVEDRKGDRHTVTSGEVSVRGILGYV